MAEDNLTFNYIINVYNRLTFMFDINSVVQR